MTNMASSSVTSFLTKLLRPDKKDKPKQPVDNKRRHSAPVPDWYEITEAGPNPVNARKLPEKQRKQHVNYASQQNLAGTKKQKQVKSKQANNKSKRQSAGFPSWFCVSGNTDTLDRSPLPLSDSRSNKHNKSNNQNIAVNNEKLKVDFHGQNEGKNGRAKENKYSAPPVELTTRKATTKSGHSEVNGKVHQPAGRQVRREVSPGVKYRTDGTLEKPYVFPAGLTFGPDGRKLHLRRTTHSQISEESPRLSRPNGKTVKVDVHMSSTEDLIMEYSYEEITQNLGEFDVRKAFYLKYDSDFNEANNQESSVDPSDNYRQPAFNYITENSQIYRDGKNSWRINETNAGKGNNTIHQNSRNRKEINRYSMPPKNEDLVYMGSYESVNMSDHVLNDNAIPNPGVKAGENTRRSRRDNTRSRRNRYSTPARNSDLVYMGSFENVNQLLTGNTDGAPGFSVCSDTNEQDEQSYYKDGDRCNRSSGAQGDQIENCKDKSIVSGYIYHRQYDLVVGTSEIASPAFDEAMETISISSFKRHSLPDIGCPTNLSIANKKSEKNASSTSEDEESDVFDDRSPSCNVNDKNPFLTRRGRASCMPGNTRFIAPPPAVTAPYISTSSAVTSADTNSARSSLFMPGSKRFSLPPPPNYTPPKEEMEFTHAHLKEMNCHKGSQADLNMELENLTMEDRDISLKLKDVKTIYGGSTSKIPDAVSRGHPVCGKLDRLELQNRTPRDKSVNLALCGHVLDVSDTSHGSDEVFQDTQSSVSEENERTKTRRFTKFRSQISNNLEQTKLPTSSALSNCKRLDQESLNNKYKITNTKSLSDVTCKNTSPASKTTFISTPTGSSRPQPERPRDKNVLIPRDKPIPTPRKLYHSDSLNKTSELSMADTNTQQTFTYNLAQPVPKQRHSLAYSRSTSTSDNYESMSTTNSLSRQKLLRTQSCDQSSTLLRKQNTACAEVAPNDYSQHIYVSINDENIYEDIDSKQSVCDLDNSKYENIYDECENSGSEKQENTSRKNQTQNKVDKQRLETSLSPLQTITLSASPGQRRRNLHVLKETATSSIPIAQQQHSCGLATSPTQPAVMCDRIGSEKGNEVAMMRFNKQLQYDDSDDNSSIADDEMSLSNEEDMEDIAKRYSLRRCVSADNLLRSGSIIDRSMILAKRRKQRMRERRSQSQLLLFPDTNFNLTNVSLKVHYTKKKRASNERLFKQKSSHTDSGLDSEIVSPCTSPDTRRHVDNMTSLNYAGASNDLSQSWVPLQGTLPRKSWEIRLRNTQHLRKCRSRESLLTPPAKMYTTSNSAFETGY